MLVFTEPSDAGTSRGASLAEHGPQRGELDRVAERRAGAVRLDVVDPPRGDAGVPVGRAQHRLLRRSARGRQAVGATVLVDRAAADHRVDRVAVGQGPGERLEHHHPHALAADVAVGRRVEGLAAPVRREEPALREAGEDLGLRIRFTPPASASSIRRPKALAGQWTPPATRSRRCRSPGSGRGSRSRCEIRLAAMLPELPVIAVAARRAAAPRLEERVVVRGDPDEHADGASRPAGRGPGRRPRAPPRRPPGAAAAAGPGTSPRAARSRRSRRRTGRSPRGTRRGAGRRARRRSRSSQRESGTAPTASTPSRSSRQNSSGPSRRGTGSRCR